MKNVVKTIKDDLWILLCDIVAVNASYYFALIVRYFIDDNIDLRKFLSIYYKFAPIYTILSIIIFYIFRLYGGMWRYAGMNDVNRIIGACIVTTIIQVLGTVLFYGRMPITYYVMGGFIQLFFLTVIRFSYRIFVLERRRSSKKAANAMIIGANEMGSHLVFMLDEGSAFHTKRFLYPESCHGQWKR